jgi:TolA-binding protein
MAKDKQKSLDERRQYIRLDTVFPIEFQLLDKDERTPITELRESFTRNIGEGGMGIFIKTLTDHDKEFFDFKPNKTKLKLIMNIPLDKEPIECLATVEWIEKETGPIVDTYIFGVSYDFINELEYEKIIRYVKWLRAKPKLIFATVTLLTIAFAFSLTFLLRVNKSRVESEEKLARSITESRQARKAEEQAKRMKVDSETRLEAVKQRQLVLQTVFKRLSEEKETLVAISESSEERAKELELQLEDLTKERALLEEQIAEEAEEKEGTEIVVAPSEGTEATMKISSERIKAEAVNFKRFKELILNEKVQALSAYVSTHRSSIYHAASLFALAELRYKYGDRTFAPVTYNKVIEMYPKSKYALYSSHRLEQLNRNYHYERYTLGDFYHTYGLPELFDYRNIGPYVK